MEEFHHQLQSWTGFFSVTAEVSGTLIGLVFVALTFNAQSLGAHGNPLLRQLARQTFSDFIKVLMISLMLLMPYNGPEGAGFSLILIAAVDTYQLGRRILELLRQTREKRRDISRRFYLSMTANVGIIAAGVLFFQLAPGSQAGWSLLFASVIMLLISGSRSAWMLLVHEGGSE